MASPAQKRAEKILTSIYYPKKKDPGAPRGQVSQPIYLPGALSSTGKLSEALPMGVTGGASMVTSAATSFGTVAGVQSAAVFQSPLMPVAQL